MTTTPTAAARVSGTIKALEWEARTDILGLHNAKGCDGYWYNVQQVADGVFVYEGHPADMPDHVSSKHPSLAAAKAAAQADYEARILAEIQPDPEPQPVAWRYRDEGEDWRLSEDGAWVVYRQSKVSCEVQPLYATPSSAGTVSVESALPVELTAAQLDDACMSRRHDHGLLGADQREDRRREAADWWRCLRKTIAEPSAVLRALTGEGER